MHLPRSKISDGFPVLPTVLIRHTVSWSQLTHLTPSGHLVAIQYSTAESSVENCFASEDRFIAIFLGVRLCEPWRVLCDARRRTGISR